MGIAVFHYTGLTLSNNRDITCQHFIELGSFRTSLNLLARFVFQICICCKLSCLYDTHINQMTKFRPCPNKKYFQMAISVCLEWLNPFPHNDTFWCPRETSLLKTLWEKEKLLLTSNFSFSQSVFYLFGWLSSILVKFEIVICKLFQFGRV